MRSLLTFTVSSARAPLGVLLAALTSGCLSYSDFLNQKNDMFCDMYAECNPEADCVLPEETAASDTGCDFDPGAGRDCLSGTWTCANDVPGFEYPLPPQACNSVCK
jgi:hypothetical protein